MRPANAAMPRPSSGFQRGAVCFGQWNRGCGSHRAIHGRETAGGVSIALHDS